MAQQPQPRQLYVQSIKSMLQYNAVRNPGATAFLSNESAAAVRSWLPSEIRILAIYQVTFQSGSALDS